MEWPGGILFEKCALLIGCDALEGLDSCISSIISSMFSGSKGLFSVSQRISDRPHFQICMFIKSSMETLQDTKTIDLPPRLNHG